MRCLLLAMMLLVCGCGTQSDKEKESFIQFINKSVDDPTGLEILGWGDANKNVRIVRFRCKQIRGATMVEDAEVLFKDGKVEQVFLPKRNELLHPPAGK